MRLVAKEACDLEVDHRLRLTDEILTAVIPSTVICSLYRNLLNQRPSKAATGKENYPRPPCNARRSSPYELKHYCVRTGSIQAAGAYQPASCQIPFRKEAVDESKPLLMLDVKSSINPATQACS